MENQSWHQNRKIQDDSVKTEHRDNTVVIIRDKSLYKPTKIGFWNDRENPSFIFPNVLEYLFYYMYSIFPNVLQEIGSVTVNQWRFQASTCLFFT